ncbi:MAG TPA: MucB/RseB C-terminal domain-containing protein [Burkholderiales bacterium]
MSAEALAPARAVVLCAAVWAAAAQAQSEDALALMRRIHDATQKLSYRGTFVYQHGARSETSRITRFVDPDGDIERVEVLDGVPRELVRTRDVVRCYLPESRVVKIERRTSDRSFPALLPERVGALARHYNIVLGETSRIAGYDCRAVLLSPRDNLRYGYRLYADAKSGMLLKAVTVDAAGQRIEQFTFTQLAIGGVTREMVRARHAATKWRIEDAEASPARLDGWSLSAELPGFRKVVELRRRMGDAKPVGQLVYSDGLAAVSVFIEPAEARQSLGAGASGSGALHVYSRLIENFRVTVVGEAPAASVQRIANAVEYRRPQ